MKYLSCVILMILCCSCGPPETILVPPDAIPIDEGRYKATLDRVEPSGCCVLPEHAEENWLITKSEDSIYKFESQGMCIESKDGIKFIGFEHLEYDICSTNISVSAYLSKTDYGFTGEVILSVDSGICGSCSDHAIISGEKLL